MVIDDSIDIPMVQKPIGQSQEQSESKSQETTEEPLDEETVNCLRKEKVTVRFVPRPYMNIQDKRHVLYGGLAEGSTVTFVVPKLSTGLYKNVLTDAEKTFLEKVMGLEYNALSIYKKKDNFWDDSNESGIGKVTLHKGDNYLDLSNPEDFIKYKILLANKDYVAPSLHDLQDRPKATYRFVIISEDAESKMSSTNMSVTMQCYKEYGKIEDDLDTLRVLVELMSGRPTSSKVKLDVLQSKINEYIQTQPKMFLSYVTDKLLPTKVVIRKSVEAGLIGKKNDYYFLRSDNSPLCEMNEESTLNNAARFLSSPKRQELLFMLQAKTKQ